MGDLPDPASVIKMIEERIPHPAVRVLIATTLVVMLLALLAFGTRSLLSDATTIAQMLPFS